MNHNLFITTSLAVKTEKSWVVKMHCTGQKGCLDPLCSVYCPTAGWGKTKYGWTYWWAGAWAPTDGPPLFGISVCLCFSFTSHPHRRRGTSPHNPLLPLPVVAFQCKWVDEWLQLAHQKASPAKGPWWLRFSQATPPLPSPTQHFVLTPLPPASVCSLCLTWRGRLGRRGLLQSSDRGLPPTTPEVSMKHFLKVAINPRYFIYLSWQRLV